MTEPMAVYGADGTYRRCGTCEAPIVIPFPADWTFELIKEGPREGPVTTWMTPHLPSCAAPPADPQPGIAARVGGQNVSDLQIALGGGWVDLGSTSEGFTWSEFRE